MAMKGPRQVILGGIQIPPWCREARHGDPGGDFRRSSTASNAGWASTSALTCCWLAAHVAHVGHQRAADRWFAPCSERPRSPGRQRSGPGAARSGLAERSGRAAGCLSHARTRAAARRSPVRQDQGCISPPACVRARTPRDGRAGCRATLGTHAEGRAGCVPHPASAAVGIGGPAVVGNAAAVAVPCGALDNAVAAVRWSKPWSLRTVT